MTAVSRAGPGGKGWLGSAGVGAETAQSSGAWIPGDQPTADCLNAGAKGAVDRGEEALGGQARQFLEVGVDGGQLGARVGRQDLPVVEADDRHVVGNRTAEVAERVEDAAGDLVGAAEDRVDVGVLCEQQRRGVRGPSARTSSRT